MSPAAIMIALVMCAAEVQPALAAIDNVATVSGTFEGAVTTSAPVSRSVPVKPITPAMVVQKSGVLNDDDGTPGVTAGDTITYTVTVENTGDLALNTIVINDPLVALTLVSGDTDLDTQLDVDETWTYSGSYILLQSDLDSNGGGDGDIDNTVTVTSDELPGGVTDDFAVDIDTNPDFTLTKTGVYRDSDGTPGLSQGDTIEYSIVLTNTGDTILTGIVVSDTLVQGGRTLPLTLGTPIESVSSDNLLNVSETWTYSPVYVIQQADIDDGGDLVNRVTATTDQTGDRDAEDTRGLTGNLVSSYTMTKSATLQDGDTDNLGDVGETIDFTFAFTNTGNTTLRDLRVNDPLAGLSAISCTGDVDGDGDIDALIPGQSLSCSANYTIAIADVVAGFVDNAATTSAVRSDGVTSVVEDDTADDNNTRTPTDTNSSIVFTKTVGTITRILPSVYEFTYTITVNNAGTVPHSGIQISDDLSSTIVAPAQLLGTPVLTTSGFGGAGGVNTNYNGYAETNLLSGDVDLAVGDIGIITVTLRVDVASRTLNASNTANYQSDFIVDPIDSDDPSETPDNNTDRQPTIVEILDRDGDGSIDTDEDDVDRDGDGNNNPTDYDPTGHLYCGPTGQILAGGQISVINLATGGIQTGVGRSNNINILRDGADGRYQFYVTEAGDYRVGVTTLPSEYPLSTDRPPAGPVLDVTSLLPQNPAILGSATNVGNSELLDFTGAANPYYFDFSIQEGDPSVFNNNLPFSGCGIPELIISKEVSSGPTLLEDGRSEITYRVTTQNIGTGPASNVMLRDDLNQTFGAGTHEVVDVRGLQPPSTNLPVVNTNYNGGGRSNLLRNPVTLEIDEVVSLSFTVIVDVVPGPYTNTAIVSGDNPASGLPLPEVTDSVPVVIVNPSDGGELLVQKTSRVTQARIGDVIPYTIKFINPVVGRRGPLDFVDVMPGGFTYIPGSAVIDGTKVDPLINGKELRWKNRTIGGKSQSVLTMSLRIGAGTPGTEFINSAWIEDPFTRKRISNISRAKVILEIEPVFQCSDIIGRVFDDLNANGYHNDGEPGLPGVRLATVNGLLITTDAYGRYHIACDAIPNEKIGSNYILKLDKRTLPTGYRVTSENPRVIRLTRGKLSKLNFAATNLRVVRLGLENKSFRKGSPRLTRAVLRDVASVLRVLEEEPAILKITYSATSGKDLSRKRLKQVEALIKRAWKAKDRPYELEVEALLKR